MPGGLDILDALSKMAVSFQVAPPGVPKRIWDEMRPWLSRLAIHAAPKWLPRLSFGFPCHVPIYQHGKPVAGCSRAAIAVCDVCAQPCCLDHARIDQFGDGICYMCVAEAIRMRQTAGPREKPKIEEQADRQTLKWARKMVGVKADTPWEEVRAAHRRMSAKHHPDRVRGEKEKARAEEKFKEVQRAFEVLLREHERQEAQKAA